MTQTQKVLLGFIVATVIIVAMILSSCASGLPSRPDTGNHGQGHSPSSACTGQYAQYVEAPTGDRYFLECWGNR